MRAASKERAAAALVVVVSLATWAPRMRFGFSMPAPYDEGNTVVAAWRVLEGDQLYRDVWQMQAPGTAYLLAGAFKALGTTLLVERGLKLLLIAASALLVQRLARHGAGLVFATAAAFLFAIDTTQYSFLRPNDPALLACLVALLLALRLPDPRGSGAALAGAVLGLGACFRHDFALYTAIALAFWLLARRQPRRLALLLGAAGLVVAAMVLALRAQGTLDEAIAQALVFPARNYAATRGLPIFDVPAFGVPLAVLAAALGVAWLRRSDALLLTALAGLAFYGYARVRPDAEHLLPARTFALAAAAGLLDAWPRRRFAALVACAGFATLAMPALLAQASLIRRAARAEETPGTPPGAQGMVGFPRDLGEAVRFLDERTPKDAAIFVGNERHDRIMANHALLYFLARRRGVSRYYNLHPGLATTAAVQLEIARALESAPAVVLWQAPLWDEPNASGRSSGVTVLDDAIRSRYREAGRWGDFSGWAPLR